MDCDAIGLRLTGFFDGELEAAEAERVRAHLEACRACRVCLADFHSVDARLRGLAVPSVADAEWGRCWGVIEAAMASCTGPAAEETARRAARLVRLLIPIAAAILVIFSAYGYTLAETHAAGAAVAAGEPDTLSMDAMVGLFGGD